MPCALRIATIFVPVLIVLNNQDKVNLHISNVERAQWNLPMMRLSQRAKRKMRKKKETGEKVWGEVKGN